MPQSLARIYIHLIFSTKNREPLLGAAVRPDLHAYLGGILRDLDSPAVEINSEPDHAHVLFVRVQSRQCHGFSRIWSGILPGAALSPSRR